MLDGCPIACYDWAMENDWAPCACGCGQEIQAVDAKGRPRRYAHGHNRRGKSNHWKRKGDREITKRTARERAAKSALPTACSLEHIGGCSSRVEVHHLDGDPWNNEGCNLLPLCTSHHKLVHSGAINLSDPKMPEFYVDGSGKRRYLREP